MRSGAGPHPALPSFGSERTSTVHSPERNEGVRPRQSSHTNVRSRFTHNCPKLETTHTCLSAGELLSSAWYLHEWNAAQNKKKEPSGIDPRRGLGWPWADSRPGLAEEEGLGNFLSKSRALAAVAAPPLRSLQATREQTRSARSPAARQPPCVRAAWPTLQLLSASPLPAPAPRPTARQPSIPSAACLPFPNTHCSP